MKSKWYRISEVKPEHKEDVHVWGSKCGLHITRWNDDFQEFEENEDLAYPKLVSHWYPFPQAPRKSRW